MADTGPLPLEDGDRELVRGMLAGDEGAFDEFFTRHFPRLFRFAQTRVASADLAEEVAQATMTTACRKLHTWRGEAALFTWLAAVRPREIAHAPRRCRRGA